MIRFFAFAYFNKMEQLSTFSSILYFSQEAGFIAKYHKGINGVIYAAVTPSIKHHLDAITIILRLDCHTDKSTVYFFRTPTNEKGVFIEYWEQRINF